MGFRYGFDVRYIDCDAQKVMHNAHYLAYVDDAVDCFLRERLGTFESTGLDFMVRRALVEWKSPLRLHDHVELTLRVSRWGTSSFAVEAIGCVGSEECFGVESVYVCVATDSMRSCPVPQAVREALSR